MTNIFLELLEGIDDADEQGIFEKFGAFGDYIYATDATSPELQSTLHFVINWVIQSERTWDQRERALSTLLIALEKNLLHGIKLEPLDTIYPDLDEELQGYVDEIFERPDNKSTDSGGFEIKPKTHKS